MTDFFRSNLWEPQQATSRTPAPLRFTSVNGVAAVVDSTVTIPTVTQLVIGGRSEFTNPLNGHIRKLAFYSRRFANSELQAISA